MTKFLVLLRLLHCPGGEEEAGLVLRLLYLFRDTALETTLVYAAAADRHTSTELSHAWTEHRHATSLHRMRTHHQFVDLFCYRRDARTHLLAREVRTMPLSRDRETGARAACQTGLGEGGTGQKTMRRKVELRQLQRPPVTCSRG